MTNASSLAHPPVRRQRSEGRVALSVERIGAASRLRSVAESGSARVRFPTVRDGVPEAVLINTAGGLASGDVVSIRLAVGAGASLVATGAAAEKVYRSLGDTTVARTEIVAEAGAHVAWMPQETILFDRARLRRCLDVDLAADATVLLFEAVTFGRAAMDERVRQGFYEERWRVRRAGRLVYADTFRLDGPIADLLARPTVAGAGRALATLLFVAPDAESRLEEARRHLEGARSECGASAWDGRLAVRWIAPDIATLRADAARFMQAFGGRDLPRVWHL